ncbi:glycine oxidase ThiO [Niallia sp. 01092]|uniref:glycine oxidase ThiO n=1 Tax=unclassified Niallia TaxID=2837522 RepID=UPI003FD1D6AA
MKQKFDVVVIGGGIIGCSIAYHLAKEKINIAVFESEKVGGKSTSAAAGMLGAHSEYKEFEKLYSFVRSSQLSYHTLSDEIKELCGIDIELKKGGIMKLAFTEEDKQELQPILSLPTVEWMSTEEVINKVPVVHSILGAAYLKEDVHVTPASACNGFSKAAQHFGASIFEYTQVLDIKKQSSHYEISTTTGKVEANFVVVASGAWSNYFFQQLGLSNQIIPVKGECLAVINEGMALKHTIFYKQHYIVPRNNNKLVIGATQKWNDWNEKTTVGGLEEIMNKAKAVLPSVTEMKIDSYWAGLRPRTFDGYPFIGSHPEDENIFFATGHQRNGILMAPATGQMIKDLIVGNQVEQEWIEAFKVGRQEKVSI